MARRARALAIAFAMAAAAPTAAPAAPCGSFTDVDAADPFCASVTWLRNREITTGCTATLYCPGSAVSRLAMAGFLSRMERLLPPAVVDANGKVFGSLLVEASLEGTDTQWVVGIHRRAGRTYALRLQGAAGAYWPGSGAAAFTGANCTGTPYIWSKGYPLTTYAAAVVQQSNGDRILYGATAPLTAATDVAVASRYWFGFCDNAAGGTVNSVVPAAVLGNLSTEYALPLRVE